MRLNSHHIIDFSKIDKADLSLVGKKAYELGQLKHLGIRIPDGFVITPVFFKKFLEQTDILAKIQKIQNLKHPAIEESVVKLFVPVQKEILRSPIPQDLTTEIYKAYKKLSGVFKEQSLNIFSSTSNNKSLLFSDVKGDANLILKIKTIVSSELEKPVAIVVQKNIKSKTKGEVLSSDIAANKKNFLTDAQSKELAHFAKKIQKHFYFPKVLGYAIEKGKIYITFVKPATTYKPLKKITQYKKSRKVLLKGISINPGIVTGPAHVIREHEYERIKNGEVVVLSQLNSSMYRKLKKARAVVIDEVLSRSQDKMLYRDDIRVPTVFGAKNATKILPSGNVITVNGISGEIYLGGLM